MQFHDPIYREDLIRNYLRRTLDAEATEAFESHYLACDECFEELRVTSLLTVGLRQSRIQFRRVDDRQSFELGELQRAFRQADTKVLIDLGRVVKIDSAGLGQLISHHSHMVKNQGMLKLLNPNAQVETLLKLTRIDSVLETFHDEGQALASF